MEFGRSTERAIYMWRLREAMASISNEVRRIGHAKSVDLWLIYHAILRMPPQPADYIEVTKLQFGPSYGSLSTPDDLPDYD